jgi:hypothetical protein
MELPHRIVSFNTAPTANTGERTVVYNKQEGQQTRGTTNKRDDVEKGIGSPTIFHKLNL